MSGQSPRDIARVIDVTDVLASTPRRPRRSRRGEERAFQREPITARSAPGFLDRALLGSEPGEVRYEACSHRATLAGDGDDITSRFFHGLALAFMGHHGFAIRPDVLMYMVCAAVAETVKRHPDAYRHLFTRSPATETIQVRHDGLRMGSPDGWDEAIELFEPKLHERVPDGIMRRMMPELSTHTPASRLATLIAFMDAASPYYEYRVLTLCGIPTIRLDGRPEDYRAVVVACAGLAEQFHAHLGGYFAQLLPVLNTIADQAAGAPCDPEFWTSIYKYHAMSGGGTIDGWATALLAYERQRDGTLISREPDLAGRRPGNWPSMSADATPTHVSAVPFIWDLLGTEHRMELVGGIVGLDNIDDFITPQLGWAVVHAR